MAGARAGGAARYVSGCRGLGFRCHRQLEPPFDLSFRRRSKEKSSLQTARLRIFCRAKTCEAVDESVIANCHSSVIPSSLMAAEREEAKAVLMLFLRKQGLSNAVSARIINKSDSFIDHLISKLHASHKSRYLLGRELTTIEIRNSLIPYLNALLEENGEALADVVEHFPNPAGTERIPASSSAVLTNLNSKKEKAIARVSVRNAEGFLSPQILYLMDLGLDLDEIKNIVNKFPAFAYYSLDRKIKPVVELFLDLGIPISDIPKILRKRPQLCGISIGDNLKPMMTYLESVGVDKNQWAKVIYRLPALLTYSRQKVKTSIDFLSELGVPEENIGKILTRCPHIISYSVDEKLRPGTEYFRSIGVNVRSLIQKCPQTFGLNIDTNLKPVTEFFLQKGYTTAEISTMVYRYSALYSISLADNIMPKWEYFLTMGYPRTELVKFPHFFGYRLEERIKPRYYRTTESGVHLALNQMLSVSDSKFEEILKRKMDKLLLAGSPKSSSSEDAETGKI